MTLISDFLKVVDSELVGLRTHFIIQLMLAGGNGFRNRKYPSTIPLKVPSGDWNILFLGAVILKNL